MEDNKFSNEEKENKKEEQPGNQADGIKARGFIWGFLIMLLPYSFIFFYFKLYSGLEIIGAFFLAILFALIGIITWAIFRFGIKKRMWGLGFLLGGFAPLLVMFIFSGGCGLFGRGFLN